MLSFHLQVQASRSLGPFDFHSQLMKLSLVSTLVLVALSLPATTDAQRDDQFALGAAVGVTLPSGLAHDQHVAGPHGTVMLGIGGVDSQFGIRFDGSYAVLGDRENVANVLDQGSTRIFSLMANGVIKLYGSDARLYGVGGLGGFWNNPDGEGTSARNDFALTAGLGFWIPRINGFVEAKWMNLYRALPDPVTGESGKRSARLYPISLGIIF